MILNKRVPYTYILKEVKFDLIYMVTIIVLIRIFTFYFDEQLPIMPISIPAFMGTSLSIILSFKLSQSYDRWWEARKIWGAIVNDSRSFILQLQSFLPPASNAIIRTLAFRHIAWCYSLGQSLRGLDPLAELDHLMTPQDLGEIGKHNNKALAILQLNAKDITVIRKKGELDVFEHIQLNTTMVNFSNQMGMAERIKSTIFPVTYRLYLKVFIYIFIITLSIAMRDVPLQYELPLLLVISTPFFLLGRSANNLQDPFSNLPTDTAMTAIARTIEINIKQLLGEKEIPLSFEPAKYYLM